MKTRNVLLIGLLVLGTASSVFAQGFFDLDPRDPSKDASESNPEPVMISTSLKPGEQVYVGQRLEFQVTVMTDSWFSKAPQFPEFDVPNTITLKPNNATINSTTRIKGATYAVQSQPYFIYPQRAGQYTIPSLQVRLTVAGQGGKPASEITLSSEEVTFTAQMPEEAAAAGLSTLIVTPRLTVEQQFDRDLASLKVGESLTRTISMSVEDSVAMLLPPLQFDPIEGVSVYPAQPQVTDESYRGNYTAKRIESVTYLLEKTGDYSLPEITVYWWNSNNEKLHQEVLPAIDFTVVENPELAAEHRGGDEEIAGEDEGSGLTKRDLQFVWKQAIILLLALAIIVMFAYLQPLRKSFIPWLKRRAAGYRISETGMLRKLKLACMHDDDRQVMNLLMRWLDYYGPQRPIAILEHYVVQADDPEFARQIERLAHQLYRQAEKQGWQGKGLYFSLQGVRKKLSPKRRVRAMLSEEPLLCLNPTDHKSERTFEPFRNTR
ncbi:MAG: protein BatD [bacterium]|nr:protein BatD [bacterium]